MECELLLNNWILFNQNHLSSLFYAELCTLSLKTAWIEICHGADTLLYSLLYYPLKQKSEMRYGQCKCPDYLLSFSKKSALYEKKCYNINRVLETFLCVLCPGPTMLWLVWAVWFAVFIGQSKETVSLIYD